MSYLKRLTVIAVPVAVFAIAGTGFSQEQSLKKKDVPKAILDQFQKSYPKATAKGYAKETEAGKVAYEIESVEGTTHRDISYSADGTVMAVEESMAYADVPEAIHTAVKKDYPKMTVARCEKIVEGAATHYELIVKSGRKKQELVYNADGALVEKEKK